LLPEPKEGRPKKGEEKISEPPAGISKRTQTEYRKVAANAGRERKRKTVNPVYRFPRRPGGQGAERNFVYRADEVSEGHRRRIHADIESINAIQTGKLLITAKLGGLLPDGRGRPKKGEEKNTAPTSTISAHTASTYRKVAANAGKLTEYREAVEAKNAELPPDSLVVTADATSEVTT
jgi:hypothetical protein